MDVLYLHFIYTSGTPAKLISPNKIKIRVRSTGKLCGCSLCVNKQQLCQKLLLLCILWFLLAVWLSVIIVFIKFQTWIFATCLSVDPSVSAADFTLLLVMNSNGSFCESVEDKTVEILQTRHQ